MNIHVERIKSANPVEIIDRRLLDFQRSRFDSDVFLIEYPFAQYYLPKSPVKTLSALIFIERRAEEVQLAVTVFSENNNFEKALFSIEPNFLFISNLCQKHQLPFFVFDQPILLQPINIPKPWGKEVWYSGIEERGQSLASDGHYAIPLPWLLSIGEKYWLDQKNTSLILLKILDPLPEPVFGDLYFEMHEEKREVYVVTNIDEDAWPKGEGGIKFGFDQSKRRVFTDDTAFKQAYTKAVENYRQVRIEIDKQLDDCRIQENIGLNEPVSAQTLQGWLSIIDSSLQKKEMSLRLEMESFINIQSLKVGDVIKVPTLTPHCLMHGVRTIEFQTPVYERKILSFAQKVLTQNHWDTESAMELVTLDAPSLPTLELLENDSTYTLESVVKFDDFEVVRATFLTAGSLTVELNDRYGIVISIMGNLTVNGSSLNSEQAMLVGGAVDAIKVESSSDNAILLIATPVD
ncbi:MAG: hypothetical protein K6L75_06275 [Cellvibrionaceae bacterium]